MIKDIIKIVSRLLCTIFFIVISFNTFTVKCFEEAIYLIIKPNISLITVPLYFKNDHSFLFRSQFDVL